MHNWIAFRFRWQSPGTLPWRFEGAGLQPGPTGRIPTILEPYSNHEAEISLQVAESGNITLALTISKGRGVVSLCNPDLQDAYQLYWNPTQIMRPRSASLGRIVGARPRVPSHDGECGFEVAGADGSVIARPGLRQVAVLEDGLNEAAIGRPGKEVPDDIVGPGVLVLLRAAFDVPDQGVVSLEAESPLDEPLAGLNRTRGGLSLVAGGFPFIAVLLNQSQGEILRVIG